VPILHSNLETDLRLAVTLDQNLLVTLTDQASIRRVPGAISFLGSVSGTGSDTSRLRFTGLGGADPFVATAAENTDVTDTVPSHTSVDIAVVRAALRRDISDLAITTGFSQDLDPARLAGDMAASLESYFNSLIATQIATAATDVGASGVDMSVDDFYDAVFTLEQASAPGPYFAMLAPVQVTDFQSSLRSESGAVSLSPATQEMLRIAGQGLVGEFMGVSIFKSSDVTDSGGNRHGAMWGAGALGYKIAVVNPTNGAGSAVVVRQDELVVEITRDASAATTEITGNAYVGAGLLEQARIVGIVTDS
jgi:hypothetical protein